MVFSLFLFRQVQGEPDISQESRKAHRGKENNFFFPPLLCTSENQTCCYDLYCSDTAKIHLVPLQQVLDKRCGGNVFFISSNLI